MLTFYALVMPFSWYRYLGNQLRLNKPLLTVFYDQQCPLCCRTVLLLNHFDVLHGVDFKPAQVFAKNYPELNTLDGQQLLIDLYALNSKGQLYAGVATYAQILIAMRYPMLLGYALKLPLIYSLACRRYRKIADNRARLVCDVSCITESQISFEKTWYARIFETETAKSSKIKVFMLTKVLVVLIFLQFNSSFHYGLLYRFHVDTRQSALTSVMTDMSNALLLFSNTFLGITPHALYLHDHFAGYNHLLAITYVDAEGAEHYLPFINEQGRMLAPNWGRVHSMWANIAVTPNIDELRLKKFIMKVTAFWGIKSGLDLQTTQFVIKMKKINTPFEWEKDLRSKNLSGEWQTIGVAQWQGKEVKITLPMDIDAL
jgi:predicted DCC family thiol-disulfide oxidoreductase YuxK